MSSPQKPISPASRIALAMICDSNKTTATTEARLPPKGAPHIALALY
jgi:hypothetical protein